MIIYDETNNLVSGAFLKCFSIYVIGSGSTTSVGEERANLSDVVYLSYVVSVCRCFLFLWVFGMGCVILLWHSLSLPYNYFE